MHPDNLSNDYPCQGDTWRKDDVDFLTVTGVAPTGVIFYMKGINNCNYTKHKVALFAFKSELERHGLTIPTYCTDKYYSTHGCY